jgi:hypothetical protein
LFRQETGENASRRADSASRKSDLDGGERGSRRVDRDANNQSNATAHYRASNDTPENPLLHRESSTPCTTRLTLIIPPVRPREDRSGRRGQRKRAKTETDAEACESGQYRRNCPAGERHSSDCPLDAARHGGDERYRTPRRHEPDGPPSKEHDPDHGSRDQSCRRPSESAYGATKNGADYWKEAATDYTSSGRARQQTDEHASNQDGTEPHVDPPCI